MVCTGTDVIYRLEIPSVRVQTEIPGWKNFLYAYRPEIQPEKTVCTRTDENFRLKFPSVRVQTFLHDCESGTYEEQHDFSLVEQVVLGRREPNGIENAKEVSNNR